MSQDTPSPQTLQGRNMFGLRMELHLNQQPKMVAVTKAHDTIFKMSAFI
jgi:hypothetical protein